MFKNAEGVAGRRLMNLHSPVTLCVGRRCRHVQFLDIKFNRVGSIFCEGKRFRDDSDHRLANVSHSMTSEGGLQNCFCGAGQRTFRKITAGYVANAGIAQVFRRQDTYNTGRAARLTDIQRRYFPVCERGAKQVQPGLFIERDVVRKQTLTGQKALIFAAPNRLAGSKYPHRIRFLLFRLFCRALQDFLPPLGNGSADLIRRIFLYEMRARHRDFRQVLPAAAIFALRAGQNGARFRVNK